MPDRGGPGAANRQSQAGSRGLSSPRARGGARLLLRRGRLAGAAIGLAAALLPQAALAHAQLLESDPAPNAVLPTVPAAVTLIFTEPVTPAGAGLNVYDPSGHQVAGPVTTRGSVLTAPVASSRPGTYVVSWQVLAADTHPSRGAFAFTVGRPSANPYSALLSAEVIGTTTPLGLGLQALARWVHFVGFALAFGVVAYQVVMRRQQRPARLVAAGIVLLIASEPLLFLAQLASLSFDPDTAIAIGASGFGRLLGLRLAAALCLWAVWTLETPWPVLGIGAVMAILDGATAHAVQGLAGAGLLLTGVHVTAMGLWAGGLAGFLRQPDRRFPRYAAVTFAVASASGVLLALSHFGSLAALGTDYGYALMVKVVVIGAALSAALLRRHRIELALVLGVLAAAAVLAALPPPR
ncbi:MAG: copper resistance protein CopC [Candidatus Dormibacterales bacterium]